MAIEQLKCGQCNWANGFILINLDLNLRAQKVLNICPLNTTFCCVGLFVWQDYILTIGSQKIHCSKNLVFTFKMWLIANFKLCVWPYYISIRKLWLKSEHLRLKCQFIVCMQLHPGEENLNLLQCSCLENSMDRGAWQVTVHGLTVSDTTECTHMHACILIYVALSVHRETISNMQSRYDIGKKS